MVKKIIVILAACLTLPACATVTKGTHEPVKIFSQPEGARAVSESIGRDGKLLSCAPTPCTINLPRASGTRITVSLDGYQPIIFAVASSRDTMNKTLPEGAIIAGAAPGTYVQSGDPSLGQKVSVSMTTAANFLITPLGVGSAVDAISGANRSLTPNPVTVYFAPVNESEQ